MKTFDEAVKLLEPDKVEQLQMFYDRYMCLSDEVKQCKAIASLIRSYKAQMKLCCSEHILAEVEAVAKAFFHFGLAVGIEMTKEGE